MKETRTEKIEAKCTKSELAIVREMASENGMSIAEFVRGRVFHDHAPKYTLFERRAMRILTTCAAYLQIEIDEFPEKKFLEFLKEKKRFKEDNDVADDLVLDEGNLTDK
jgi:hypothetical protein